MQLTDRQACAEILSSAKKDRRPIRALTERWPRLTLSDAYAIQSMVLETDLAAGERLVGYKMGLTSYAKQRDVGVFEPIHGYLLSSMEIGNGEPLDISRRIHPRIEPEVAVVTNQRLSGNNLSLNDVLSAIECMVPAVEVIDSRFEAYAFKLPDVIADNTSASGFILGMSNWKHQLEALRLAGISVRKNGALLETGAPAAVLGNPLRSLLALIRSLATENRSIDAGTIVLTGGITASVPVSSGDWIEIDWPGETMSFKVG